MNHTHLLHYLRNKLANASDGLLDPSAWNFTDSSVSVHPRRNFHLWKYFEIRWYLDITLRVMLMLLGLAGSALLLVHFVRWIRQRREQPLNMFYCFLLNYLAINIIWLGILGPILIYVDEVHIRSWTAGHAACQFYFYMVYVVFYASTYGILLLIVYQCVHILRPKLLGPYDTWPWGVLVCGVFWVLILLGNIYRALHHKTRPVQRYYYGDFSNTTTATTEFCLPNLDLGYIASLSLFVIFGTGFPILIMIIGTLLLVWSTKCSGARIYGHMDEESNSPDATNPGNSVNESRNITSMLIVLTLAKLVCSLPRIILIFVTFSSVTKNHYMSLRVVGDLCNWLNGLYPGLVPFIIFIYLPDLRPVFCCRKRTEAIDANSNKRQDILEQALKDEEL